MFEKFKYRTSFAFGRKEHAASRILFVLIIMTFILYLLKKDVTFFFILDIVCWIVYWLCHRLEKWFHPKINGRRI